MTHKIIEGFSETYEKFEQQALLDRSEERMIATARMSALYNSRPSKEQFDRERLATISAGVVTELRPLFEKYRWDQLGAMSLPCSLVWSKIKNQVEPIVARSKLLKPILPDGFTDDFAIVELTKELGMLIEHSISEGISIFLYAPVADICKVYDPSNNIPHYGAMTRFGAWIDAS